MKQINKKLKKKKLGKPYCQKKIIFFVFLVVKECFGKETSFNWKEMYSVFYFTILTNNDAREVPFERTGHIIFISILGYVEESWYLNE